MSLSSSASWRVVLSEWLKTLTSSLLTPTPPPHTCAHTNRTKRFPKSLLQKLTLNQYIIYQLCNDSIDNVFIDLINNIVIGIYLLLILLHEGIIIAKGLEHWRRALSLLKEITVIKKNVQFFFFYFVVPFVKILNHNYQFQKSKELRYRLIIFSDCNLLSWHLSSNNNFNQFGSSFHIISWSMKNPFGNHVWHVLHCSVYIFILFFHFQSTAT